MLPECSSPMSTCCQSTMCLIMFSIVLATSAVKHVSIIGRRGPIGSRFHGEGAPGDDKPPRSIHDPPSSLAPSSLPHLLLNSLASRRASSNSSIIGRRSPRKHRQNLVSRLFPLSNRSGSTETHTSCLAMLISYGTGPRDATRLTHRRDVHFIHRPRRYLFGIPRRAYSQLLVPRPAPLAHSATVSGRIITSTGATLRNVYASGWASTGAKGVLASTMTDAYDVVGLEGYHYW